MSSYVVKAHAWETSEGAGEFKDGTVDLDTLDAVAATWITEHAVSLGLARPVTTEEAA